MCDIYTSADPIHYEQRTRSMRIHGVVTSIRLENLCWDILARIAAKGWAAPLWPKEHGGPGWTPAQHYVFEAECARAGAPNLAPMGLRMTKEGLNISVDASGLEAVMAIENRNQTMTAKSGNFAEGMRAFMEKRKPDFSKL